MQLLYDLQHLARELGVKCARRLVKEQDRGIHRKRSCDRNTLLLTAGKLAGIGICLLLKTHFLQKRHCTLLGLLLRAAENMHLRVGEVFKHRKVREEVKVLKHQTEYAANFLKLCFAGIHGLAFGVVLCSNFAEIDKLAAVHLGEQCCAAKKRRLAGARGTDYRHDLALVNAQTNILEDMQRCVIEAFLNVVYL